MKKVFLKKAKLSMLILLMTFAVCLTGCGNSSSDSDEHESQSTEQVSKITHNNKTDSSNVSKSNTKNKTTNNKTSNSGSGKFKLSSVPKYSKTPYAVINDNEPFFTKSEITKKSFEKYSELDSLGRCGVAFSSVGKDLMPTTERESIGSVKPSGWQTAKYDCVNGKYLYNRCHLIGYQLTAENANEKNLITGTRYLNVDGMLPFENMVADYVKETDNHVLYRVTPVFSGDNLVADGVLMEAYSVEDKGEGITFCVFCYNVQPGVKIDYKTGKSTADSKSASVKETTKETKAAAKKETTAAKTTKSKGVKYVVNINTKKFHLPSCSSAKRTAAKNKEEITGTRDELISKGYEPCENCNP